MSSSDGDCKEGPRKTDLIRKLLKGIETGDPEAASVVNESVYIQHNPQTHEGSEGLAALFARLSKTNPRVNVARAFQDGDYVFGHTEYDFSTRRIGFEVFRFEGNHAVEHWDNIQPRLTDDMITGPTEATQLQHTERNRERIRQLYDNVLLTKRWTLMPNYVEADIRQHSPYIGKDGIEAMQEYFSATGGVDYQTVHRILAEGDFCLAVTEGEHAKKGHASFYDMYRLNEDGLVVEHWDTLEAVPPKSEWKNNNGKF